VTDARGVFWRDRAAALPGSGLWIDEPYRVIAAAFLCFALLG